MKIIVPSIVRPVYLTEYAPELKAEDGTPVTVWVWVNPPARLLDEFDAARQASDAIAKLSEWYAVIWSQHSDTATHWTAADVRALIDSDADPGLWVWLGRQTFAMITGYRAGEKKVLTPPA